MRVIFPGQKNWENGQLGNGKKRKMMKIKVGNGVNLERIQKTKLGGGNNKVHERNLFQIE